LFKFFKINDPYRLIAIFFIAFAIKIPFLISSSGYFEMYHWLIIGEAMQSGHMYAQIFDSLAPLSATTYWLVVAMFGKSVLALHILGTLLLIVQVVIFNNLTIQNKVYEQNTYLPAFVFLMLSSSHYSLSVFSPAQLGITFILLAFSKLLAHVEFRAKRDEQIMSIGLLLGMAVLFYLPYIIFLVIVLIILLVFTNTLKRRYAILIISALIPLLITYAYYWLANGEAGYFAVNFVAPSLTVDFSFLAHFWHNIGLFLPLLVFWFLGLITMPKQRRLNNYQNRLAQLFFLTGLLSVLIMVYKDTGVDTAIMLLVPVAAYFTSHLAFLIKRPMLDVMISILFVSLVLFINYDSEFGFFGLTNNIEQEVKVDNELISLVKDKKIMVLGDKPQIYKYGSLATPFYNWSLSRPVIENLEYYDNIVLIKESVDKFQPQIIIDYEQNWRKIMQHIPEFKNQYKLVRPFVWQRLN
jgi:uncharacterized protein DUF6427